MTPARFRALLRVRGPALELWPEDDRAAARLLMAVSRRCRSGYLEALEGDQTLDDSIDPALLARLRGGARQRIARNATPPERRVASSLAVSFRFGTLAACGLLGAWLGWRGIPPQPAPHMLAPYLLAELQVTALDPGALDPAP
jgi:hypothetical protein